MKRKFLIVFLCAFLLSGCRIQPDDKSTGPICRVVTAVTVTYENGALRTQRLYKDADKMQTILNYLRLIDPYGNPEENPEQVEGSLFRIVLSYSDGFQKTYLQKADRFMMVEGEEWKRIDPDDAAQLSEIVGQMASDTDF